MERPLNVDIRQDAIAAGPVRALAAALDRDDPVGCDGELLPALWHWIFFRPEHRSCDLRPDGHPRRQDATAPPGWPRRMWAGTRVSWHEPLRIGDRATRESVVHEVRQATGRSGPLLFVTLRHRISSARGLCVVEEQDMVYRGADAGTGTGAGGSPPAVPDRAGADWRLDVVPDEVLLFRYSALTFNSHRIHYDQPYATGVEGHRGLVVQGGLVATLLLEAARRHQPGGLPATLHLRARRPAFARECLGLQGRRLPDGQLALWATDAGGLVTLDGNLR